MSHILARSKLYNDRLADQIRQSLESLRVFEQSSKEIQREHKSSAVKDELEVIRKKALSDLNSAQTGTIAEYLKDAIRTYTGAPRTSFIPRPMIVIRPDGTVSATHRSNRADRILSDEEFKALIQSLIKRAETDQLNLDESASSIARSYLIKFCAPV